MALPLLKRLKLGNMAPTLPERIALARREQLDYASFLEIILSDEVNRRDHQRMDRRMRAAGFATGPKPATPEHSTYTCRHSSKHGDDT